MKNRIFKTFCLLLVSGAVGFAGFKFFKSEKIEENPAKLEKKQSGVDRREAGLRFRRLTLQDENGVVAPDGLRKARKHLELMKQAQKSRAAKQKNQIQEAGVISESWTWLGPGNIGGRIRSIDIHPNNAQIIFVGSVSGGIWRTVNGGASWSPVNDFMSNLAVTSIVRHPTNLNTMYAGTGECFGNIDAILGGGIFRSTDGGTTWTQLPSTDNTNFNCVLRLAISPNGNTILAGTVNGVFRSTNAGVSWTRTDSAGAADVDFHPTDSNRAVFGHYGRAAYSEDRGQTWTAANLPINGRVETTYAPSNPNIVYATSEFARGEIYRSSNGGQSFSRVNTGSEYMGKQGWYNNSVWVNPQDENFIIVGGVNLFKSTDGGATLTEIADGNSGSAHDDHHFIVAHPAFNNSTNKTVFFGNDGGIYRTNDVSTVTPTSGWTELNNTLGITQFYGGTGNSTSGIIIGGTQDNGTLRYSGGTENWTETFGADGGFAAADQTDPNYFYGEKQDLGVFRSSDAGLSATDISSGITD